MSGEDILKGGLMLVLKGGSCLKGLIVGDCSIPLVLQLSRNLVALLGCPLTFFEFALLDCREL